MLKVEIIKVRKPCSVSRIYEVVLCAEGWLFFFAEGWIFSKLSRERERES